MSNYNNQIIQLTQNILQINQEYDRQIQQYQDNKRLFIVQHGMLVSELIRNNSSNQSIVSSIFSTFTSQRPVSSETPHTHRLRPSDISLLTKCCLYSSIENPINTSCPITLIPFQPNDEVIQLIRCKHIFSKDAIFEALERDSRCPYCRTDLHHIQEEVTFEFTTIP